MDTGLVFSCVGIHRYMVVPFQCSSNPNFVTVVEPGVGRGWVFIAGWMGASITVFTMTTLLSKSFLLVQLGSNHSDWTRSVHV